MFALLVPGHSPFPKNYLLTSILHLSWFWQTFLSSVICLWLLPASLQLYNTLGEKLQLISEIDHLVYGKAASMTGKINRTNNHFPFLTSLMDLMFCLYVVSFYEAYNGDHRHPIQGNVWTDWVFACVCVCVLIVSVFAILYHLLDQQNFCSWKQLQGKSEVTCSWM